MIIKYYTKDDSLVIIENVTDVRVPANPAFGDYALEPWQVFDFDGITETANTSDEANPPKIITYAKDGPCMLKVWGVAYVCNDDGKTLEKVCANG